MSPNYDPGAAIDALADAGVHFIVIGGIAARIHGSPSITSDIDVCYSRDQENLERLTAALVGLHAHLRGASGEVPFVLDARSLMAGANFTFTTDVGDVDVLALPSGVAGYDELLQSAVALDFGGVTIQVCSLDDLIRMKRAAGRPKDRVELEILEALRDELKGDTDGEISP